MPIKFECPQCKKPVTMADNLAGKRARCIGCQTVFVVPAHSGATASVHVPGAGGPKPAASRPSGAGSKKTLTESQIDFGLDSEEETSSRSRRRRQGSRGTLVLLLITVGFVGAAGAVIYYLMGTEQTQNSSTQVAGVKPSDKPASPVAPREPEKNSTPKDALAKDGPARDRPTREGPGKDGPARDPMKDPMVKPPMKDPMVKNPRPVTTGSLTLDNTNDPILAPGTKAMLTITVERKECQGIVEIQGKGEKVTLKPGRAAPGQTEVDLELTVAKDAEAGLHKLELKGTLGSLVAKKDISVLVRTAAAAGTALPMHMPGDGGKPPLTLIGHEGVLLCAALSPDGKKLVTGSIDKMVRVWNAATGEALATLEPGDLPKFPISGVGFSPDGKLIVACQDDSQQGQGLFWEADSGKFLPEKCFPLKRKGSTFRLVFLPDGKQLLSCGQDGSLVLYDFTANPQPKLVKTLAGHSPNTAVSTVSISADGKTAVSGGDDGTIRLWDLVAGKEKKKLTGGHAKEVTCVALTPDGQKVISGGSDKKVIVWEVDKGMPLFKMDGHTERVLTVAVSPDGKRAASGGQDQTICLWDLETGKEQFELQGHKGEVRQVVFSPDGSQLASASYDNTAMIWFIAGVKVANEAGAIAALEKLGAKVNTRGNQPGRPVIEVNLTNRQIADADLKWLADFKQLQSVNLADTPITDAGLKELAACKQLQELVLIGTKVTARGRKELQDALPKCKIE